MPIGLAERDQKRIGLVAFVPEVLGQSMDPMVDVHGVNASTMFSVDRLRRWLNETGSPIFHMESG
jgi:hypothetical protein